MQPKSNTIIMGSSMDELEAFAQRYAQHGLAVFPLKMRDKVPVTSIGFKDATTDKEQIERWFADGDRNIGIALPEHIVVLDIDRHGDVDGWVWGDGSTAPPQVTFAEVCPDQAPAPPATPSAPTALASPLPTQPPATAPAPQPTAGQGRAAFPTRYVAFALLALGLLAVLVWGVRRRR